MPMVWCLLASLSTSLLYFNSKIEKDDKSPGEESDISDDDTGLLLFLVFIFSY